MKITKDKTFQKEILQMLQPKINSILYETKIQDREDLRQEIHIAILKVLKEKDFQDPPSFFELIKTAKDNHF